MGGKKISLDEKKAIIKVYEYFKLTAERGKLRIRLSNYAKRTMDIFKLKERTLMKIISDKSKANDTEVESSEPKCEKRGQKEKLDTFQKD